MFRYELHLHTCETSICASASGEEAVRTYARLGYTGVVVTNHMNPEKIEDYRSKGWEATVSHLFAGYHAAHAHAAANGITVLPGMEVRFPTNWNDYLIYGTNEAGFLAHPEIADMRTFPEFKLLCAKEGWLAYQAHPFRNNMTIVDPKYLDGIEVYNGHVNHNSRNGIAAAWAELHGLPGICGSDFHDMGAEGTTAMCVDHQIANEKALVLALKAGAFQMETGRRREGLGNKNIDTSP